MPVIINEFEIVSDSAGEQEGLPGDAQLSPPKPNVLPQEVEAVLEMYQQRCARVRAD
ncbi:MAG TPA: hypothetical protein VF268_12370 [Gammaproteobacteria bacterium]|jgi:hypothetical protein